MDIEQVVRRNEAGPEIKLNRECTMQMRRSSENQGDKIIKYLSSFVHNVKNLWLNRSIFLEDEVLNISVQNVPNR